jgi:hypothetical protein
MLNRNNPGSGATQAVTTSPETAARRVMLAVLQDAVKTFEQGLHSGRAIDRQRFNEVDRWVASDDTDRLFTFENVCGALGLDPDYMRDGLRRLKVEAYSTGDENSVPSASALPRRRHPRRR